MLLSVVLALLAAQAQPVTSARFRYRVELARAGDTTVAISIEAPEPLAGPVTLVIPRAVPMGYSQQAYDRYVGDVTASGEDGAPVAVEREDGPRFRPTPLAAGDVIRLGRVSMKLHAVRADASTVTGAD